MYFNFQRVLDVLTKRLQLGFSARRIYDVAMHRKEMIVIKATKHTIDGFQIVGPYEQVDVAHGLLTRSVNTERTKSGTL